MWSSFKKRGNDSLALINCIKILGVIERIFFWNVRVGAYVDVLALHTLQKKKRRTRVITIDNYYNLMIAANYKS